MDNLPEKYRPHNITDLYGQPNAQIVYNLADKYVAPCYLFFGPPGTGKTSSAKLIISKIESGFDIFNGKFISDIIEVNCGLNGGVDDIKDIIINKCQTPPRMLSRKYVILDEAQVLTQTAQYALLNIMEMPPPYLTFILCTTEQRKLLHAVKSRCLQTKFIPGAVDDLSKKIIEVCKLESIPYDAESVDIIARSACGSFREAVIILSQYMTMGATIDNVGKYSGSISKALTESILISCFKKDFKSLINQINDIIKSNIKIEEVLKLMLEVCIDLITQKVTQKNNNSSEISSLSLDIPLIKICDILSSAISSMSPATPENLHFQVAMFKIASASK